MLLFRVFLIDRLKRTYYKLKYNSNECWIMLFPTVFCSDANFPKV